MAWTYHDWREQATATERLTRLRQHLGEVAQKIQANLASGGDSRSNDVLQRYYDSLVKDEQRLVQQVGDVDKDDVRVAATFIRGRPL